MNAQTFENLLNELDAHSWDTLLGGAYLRLVDDEQLIVSEEDTPDRIIAGADFTAGDAAELKRTLLERAEDILHQYYRTHPLTQKGFNKQLRQLAEQHGIEAFMAVGGQRPDYTLFVEGGELVAEPKGSPRHPYGAFLELEQALPENKREDAFAKWLDSGSAYEQYLSMNVCRYNC